MAATIEQVLAIAANEIGYVAQNDPMPGSKYGRWMTEYTGESWYSGDDIAWCAMFVSWVFASAGQYFPGMPDAYCGTILGGGQNAGLGIPTANLSPGDLVIFNWPCNDEIYDHIGIVESVGDGYFITIEGNTIVGGGSSQVARQTRYYSDVLGVVRPDYTFNIPENGYWGTQTTRALQHHYGTVIDGEVWHQWEPNVAANPVLTDGWICDATGLGSPMIRAMQGDLGTEQDGVFGAPDILALKSLFGGYYGNTDTLTTACVWELQHQLNGGVWPMHL